MPPPPRAGARSWLVSKRTSTWPSLAQRPESKLISCTLPGRSALNTTPWTATTVPMAAWLATQLSSFATTVVTASGGCVHGMLMAILIWRYLSRPSAPTRAKKSPSVIISRLRMSKSPLLKGMKSKRRTHPAASGQYEWWRPAHYGIARRNSPGDPTNRAGWEAVRTAALTTYRVTRPGGNWGENL